MPTGHVISGLPTIVLKKSFQDGTAVKVETNCINTSVSIEFSGDLTAYDIVVPSAGNRIVVKGMTIIGDGNVGTIKISRSINGATILPCYMGVRATQSASSALHLELLPDEKIQINTTQRGDNETFVGITYTEIDSDDEWK